MRVSKLLLDATEGNRHEAINMLTISSHSNSARLIEVLPKAETVNLEGCGAALTAERPNPVPDQLIRVVVEHEKSQFADVFRLHGRRATPQPR